MFLVWVFSAGLAWKQITRSWSSGRFRSWRARSTSVGERPARGFLSVALSFSGESGRTSSSGEFLVLFCDDRGRCFRRDRSFDWAAFPLPRGRGRHASARVVARKWFRGLGWVGHCSWLGGARRKGTESLRGSQLQKKVCSPYEL